MKTSAGLRSVAVGLPKTIRTNAYYRERHPDIVAKAEERTLAKVFSASATATDPFSRAMQPYLNDPFRGTVERRVLAEGETMLQYETVAAKRALGVLGMQPNDVDLMIVAAFVPDQLGVGNAAFLANELGMKRPAWNIESACAGSLVALQTASSLVESGRYRNILVVASCAYSRVSDDADSVSWFLGDAAGAFVVGQQKEGDGLLGMHMAPTTQTCDTFYYEPNGGDRRMTMRCTPKSGQRIAEVLQEMPSSCEQALREAGLTMKDVDFVVCNTPMAWFADFAADALGVDRSRTIDTFPSYGNVGAALIPVNLHAAAAQGKIKKGDIVLLYAVGSVSSAGAAVIRWGDVSV